MDQGEWRRRESVPRCMGRGAPGNVEAHRRCEAPSTAAMQTNATPRPTAPLNGPLAGEGDETTTLLQGRAAQPTWTFEPMTTGTDGLWCWINAEIDAVSQEHRQRVQRRYPGCLDRPRARLLAPDVIRGANWLPARRQHQAQRRLPRVPSEEFLPRSTYCRPGFPALRAPAYQWASSGFSTRPDVPASKRRRWPWWPRWKASEEKYFLGLLSAALGAMAEAGLIAIPAEGDLPARMLPGLRHCSPLTNPPHAPVPDQWSSTGFEHIP